MPILSNFPCGHGNGIGIALDTVSNITTIAASGKVYVKWTDPNDIAIDDSVLAEWGGTLLVRKAGSMPTSRRDGTIVIDSTTRNQYSNSYFCDSGLSDDTTYYYKFFPYTTTGTYTDSEDDGFTATPTAQVHGIDSWNVTNIVTSEEAGDGKMAIKWSDPSATITSDGVTLATWGSTTIVLKTGSYATSKDDPSAVYTLKVTTRNQYASTPLTVTGLINGTTYYISFFPETTDGGINTSTTQRGTGVANRITITNFPSQSGDSLTYNGSPQSPTWSNYNETYMTIGGTTSSTNAGSYNATFTPKTDYRWSDGTITTKTVSWSIGKAAGTLTLSKESIELNMSTPSTTFTISGNHDGTLSVVSNNTGIATVSHSGSTVTVTHVNQTTGSTTITVSCTEGTNYTAPTSKTINVEAKFISTVLNDNEWSVIKRVSDENMGSNYWSVGDRKAVDVNGTIGSLNVSGTYYVYIIGFNHNNSKEGNGITFGTFKSSLSGGIDICLVDSYYGRSITNSTKCFNMVHKAITSSSASVGWAESDIRYDILGSTDTSGGDATSTTATSPVSGTLMAALPSDLRAVMRPMHIYTDNVGKGGMSSGGGTGMSITTYAMGDGDSSYVTKSIDYLPLLAEFEISGARSHANSSEENYQDQYQYYKNGNSKLKYCHNETSTPADWWVRSPSYLNSLYFCMVYSGGSSGGGSGYYSRGIAPIFRV